MSYDSLWSVTILRILGYDSFWSVTMTYGGNYEQYYNLFLLLLYTTSF